MATEQAQTFETIEYEVRDGVATIALNRPEKRNAINMQLHKDLAAALRLVQRDREVRALLLTGRGPGFCAGQDLTEFSMARADPDFRVDDHVRSTFNRTIMTIRALPMPVIAAVNGVAAGAGWSLALAADIRIAAEDARFTQAFSKIGLLPDTGSTWFLPELIGTSRSLELMYSGDLIDADRALSLGLVNEIVAGEQLAEHAHAYAASLAKMPTMALALTKRAVYRAPTSTLEDALEYEAQLQQHAAASDDHVEGVTAFLEKRDPVFTGR
ncbi:MAG: enoyl-CoA hydratase/isomerase family protein [Thermoleophilia bacterium]|nr:enoyl-CoA hydratase/isomerase family protein [Thermoleophilia bacterium]